MHIVLRSKYTKEFHYLIKIFKDFSDMTSFPDIPPIVVIE